MADMITILEGRIEEQGDEIRSLRAENSRLAARVAELEASKQKWIDDYMAVAEDYNAKADRVAELEGQVQAWQHHANEWADAATNGPQWVKNIRDGINTTDEALARMAADFQHCRDTHPSTLAGKEVSHD